jgi:hypothetical protein
MKSSVALLLVLSVAGLTIFGQAPGDEWNRYDITVELDTKAHTLSGFELVEYVNDSDQTLESLYFFLWANFLREKNPYVDEALIDEDYWNGFDLAWTKIAFVTTEEGKALNWQLEAAPPVSQTYSLQETLLRVDLPTPLAPGEKIKLRIEFTHEVSRSERAQPFIIPQRHLRLAVPPVVSGSHSGQDAGPGTACRAGQESQARDPIGLGAPAADRA